MCFIIRNDRASPYFASGAGRRRNGNKMRDVIGDIYITANKVIIFKKVFAMIYPKHNCPCNIQCSATANADNGIALRWHHICPFLYIHPILQGFYEYHKIFLLKFFSFSDQQ